MTIDPTRLRSRGIGNYHSMSLLMPGHRLTNRMRHTWPWRWAFFALGFLLGWLAHGFV